MISRRQLMRGATIAAAADLLGLSPEQAQAEPPPETTRLKILQSPGICFAPQFVADELLRSEGFTEVQHVTASGAMVGAKALASGEVHFSTQTAGLLLIRIAAGDPIVFLSGLHVGCFELFGTTESGRFAISKGKRWPSPISAPVATSCSPAWRPTWDSIP